MGVSHIPIYDCKEIREWWHPQSLLILAFVAMLLKYFRCSKLYVFKNPDKLARKRPNDDGRIIRDRVPNSKSNFCWMVGDPQPWSHDRTTQDGPQLNNYILLQAFWTVWETYQKLYYLCYKFGNTLCMVHSHNLLQFWHWFHLLWTCESPYIIFHFAGISFGGWPKSCQQWIAVHLNLAVFDKLDEMTYRWRRGTVR